MPRKPASEPKAAVAKKTAAKETVAKEPVAQAKVATDVPTETPAPKPADQGRITGRHLRRARRKARRLGLEPADDHEAIRMLREKGVDILAEDSVLEMLPDEPELQLPAKIETSREVAQPANAGLVTSVEREREIKDIQRNLVVRRRKRLGLLALKLLFFVALPTFIAGYYYYVMATPMYETKSEFVIQKAESTGGGGLGGLFAGTGFGAAKDSITVQGYLTGREAMLRLDEEHRFLEHFQQEFIDDRQRLPRDASQEAAFKLYSKRIKVGFDSSEGIIRMSVVAATPEASERYSKALVSYAEERVDQLTLPLREDQLAGAQKSYEDAEGKMLAAQNRVLSLQEKRGILNTETEIQSQMTIINSLELELEKRRLDLAEVLDNARPNESRAGLIAAEIKRMETRVAELRSAFTQSNAGGESLARVSAELRIAEADLATRQILMQESLQQLESARIEASRQVLYLSLGVAPVAPDEATYPRKFENTLLAFVIFGGIYILISLTVSILREQLSV